MPAWFGVELACMLVVDSAERRLSLIRVILLTVVLWRIGLIVVRPISIVLRRIVKNRGIILVRIIIWIIWLSLLTWSSRWTLSIYPFPLDCHHKAI